MGFVTHPPKIISAWRFLVWPFVLEHLTQVRVLGPLPLLHALEEVNSLTGGDVGTNSNHVSHSLKEGDMQICGLFKSLLLHSSDAQLPSHL